MEPPAVEVGEADYSDLLQDLIQTLKPENGEITYLALRHAIARIYMATSQEMDNALEEVSNVETVQGNLIATLLTYVYLMYAGPVFEDEDKKKEAENNIVFQATAFLENSKNIALKDVLKSNLERDIFRRHQNIPENQAALFRFSLGVLINHGVGPAKTVNLGSRYTVAALANPEVNQTQLTARTELFIQKLTDEFEGIDFKEWTDEEKDQEVDLIQFTPSEDLLEEQHHQLRLLIGLKERLDVQLQGAKRESDDESVKGAIKRFREKLSRETASSSKPSELYQKLVKIKLDLRQVDLETLLEPIRKGEDYSQFLKRAQRVLKFYPIVKALNKDYSEVVRKISSKPKEEEIDWDQEVAGDLPGGRGEEEQKADEEIEGFLGGEVGEEDKDSDLSHHDFAATLGEGDESPPTPPTGVPAPEGPKLLQDLRAILSSVEDYADLSRNVFRRALARTVLADPAEQAEVLKFLADPDNELIDQYVVKVVSFVRTDWSTLPEEDTPAIAARVFYDHMGRKNYEVAEGRALYDSLGESEVGAKQFKLTLDEFVDALKSLNTSGLGFSSESFSQSS